MKRHYVKILLLLVIILTIVPLYVLVQGYVARYLPTFLITSRNLSFVSVKGRLAVTIIGSEFVGSLVVAFITLLPVGYTFPKRWAPASAVLVAITLVALLFVFPAGTIRSWFMDVIRVGEYLSIITAYFLMALVGSRLSRHTLETDV
ncbi:MAG TPA: hypothetical protein VK568_05485 [Thermodesulfobacteriota bacterium]|jgi:hypothetical protein|nr:hypothetical protein [Thermodesulfobacteriota bacterium]